jgi:hypothetical protein
MNRNIEIPFLKNLFSGFAISRACKSLKKGNGSVYSVHFLHQEKFPFGNILFNDGIVSTSLRYEGIAAFNYIAEYYQKEIQLILICSKCRHAHFFFGCHLPGISLLTGNKFGRFYDSYQGIWTESSGWFQLVRHSIKGNGITDILICRKCFAKQIPVNILF